MVEEEEGQFIRLQQALYFNYELTNLYYPFPRLATSNNSLNSKLELVELNRTFSPSAEVFVLLLVILEQQIFINDIPRKEETEVVHPPSQPTESS